MSTSFYFSFGLLITLFVYISSSSVHYPVNAVSYQETNNNNKYNSNEDENIPLIFIPKSSLFDRIQRSSAYHPRISRNSWFRVSTYQHMKPTGESDEKPSGDNLMRWG